MRWKISALAFVVAAAGVGAAIPFTRAASAIATTNVLVTNDADDYIAQVCADNSIGHTPQLPQCEPYEIGVKSRRFTAQVPGQEGALRVALKAVKTDGSSYRFSLPLALDLPKGGGFCATFKGKFDDIDADTIGPLIKVVPCPTF